MTAKANQLYTSSKLSNKDSIYNKIMESIKSGTYDGDYMTAKQCGKVFLYLTLFYWLTLYLGKAFIKMVAKLSNSPSTPSKSDTKGSKEAPAPPSEKAPTPAKSDKAPTPAKPTEEGEGRSRLRKRKDELPPEKKGKEEMSDEEESDDDVSSFFYRIWIRMQFSVFKY